MHPPPRNSKGLSRPWFLIALWFAVAGFPCCTGRAEVDLPFGDINVLVLTDVHSWIGGHSNDPTHNADYGDILSFYQRIHEHCIIHNMDVWLVVNGDWIDGTGLSLSLDSLIPLLEKMNFDALNVGNHELYKASVVHDFMRPGGFVESWGDRYLSSNVLYAPTNKPLGYRHKFLRGKNSTVLTFGFLYNMDDASPAAIVQQVENVIEEDWFTDVVTNANKDPNGNFDAILVLAHMDVKDKLVTVLLIKIRALVGDTMPVQFVTGHTHYRGVHTMDDASVSFEAGKYLDTVGFVSFPTQKTQMKHIGNRKLQEKEEEGEGESPVLLGPGGTEWPNVSDSYSGNASAVSTPTSNPTARPTNATSMTPGPTPPNQPATENPTAAPTRRQADLFHHVFIDTNVETLKTILGVSELSTEDGARLSQFIFRTRSELGLLEQIGCSPQPYYVNRTTTENDSIWKLFLTEVAPYQLLKTATDPNQERMFLGGSGALRYDLLGPQLIKDDIIAVSPFNETIFSLSPSIPGSVVQRLVIEVLNAKKNPFDPRFENFNLFPDVDDLAPDTRYEIMVPAFSVSTVLDGLAYIQYNGTVKQIESGFLSTELWLKFVKDNWECTEGDAHNQGGQHTGHDGAHHHGESTSGGQGKDKGVHSGAPHYTANEEEDKRRTIMASIALACVVLLGGLYIFQLHRTWLTKYKERQRLIFTIDEENDNELI